MLEQITVCCTLELTAHICFSIHVSLGLSLLPALPPSAKRHVPFELVLSPLREDSLSFRILHQHNTNS